MRKKFGIAAAIAAGAMALVSAPDAQASSHREAPFVTKNPKVDSTDFYMFLSYESGRAGYVTMVANYLPLQDAYGGPNYFALDPEALYEIHIDNNADGGEDVTFQFEFNNDLQGANGITLPITLKDGAGADSTKTNAVPLINIGAVTAADSSKQHVLESYTLKMVKGDRRTGQVTNLGTTFKKPLDNVGTTTFPDYETYARSFITEFDIPGCTPPSGTKSRVFVGQRAEGFAANIGVIFDLLQGGDAGFAGAITSGASGRNNADPQDNGLLYKKNVTSIAVEVPVDCLRTSSAAPIIGGWTTASMRQARVLNPNATFGLPAKEGGAWTQVSRLGMPLVNEVVIGLKDKDKFSSSSPKGDSQFADYVTHPTLPAIIELLYGSFGAVAPKKVRTDLVAVFAQGLEVTNAADDSKIKFTQNTTTGVFEYTRLNTGLPGGVTSKANQNRLGVTGCLTADRKVDLTSVNASPTGCDLNGFPNGRRPGDDTVDIALRVVMGALFGNDTDAPARDVAFTDLNYNAAEQFDEVFPYLRKPFPGNGGTY